MKSYDVMIIGGGIAGTMAAETFRAGAPEASIAIISDEPHPLYSRVLLPHAVKGKLPDANVFLKKDSFYAEKRIEAIFGRTVQLVSPHPKTVTLDGGEELGYGKLVIAIGGKPRDLGIEGDHLPGILRLQKYEDILSIRQDLMPGSELVIIGAGFIGLEFASIAIEKKIKCTLLNRGPHLWTSMLGPKLGAAVEAKLRGHGIEVRNDVKVSRVVGEHRALGVELSTGERVNASAVGVGIGLGVPVEPFSGFAHDGDGIHCDASLKVRDDVWTAGDCAAFEDLTLGGFRHAVGNWTNAMAQGRHVGKALLGEDKPFELVSQYTSACVPGLSFIFLGETRMRPGAERIEEIADPSSSATGASGKGVEWRVLNGKTIGAILLNAADRRAEALAKIGRRQIPRE